MKYLISLALIINLIFSATASAELTFSAPPRERTSDEGNKTYGQLVERLSEVLGEKVVYQQPRSWPEYSSKMRKEKYDIIFDGPHLTSWRIKNIGHQSVSRLPGHLGFHIVTRKDNKEYTDLNSLRRATVCALASPNLTSSVLLDSFRNEAVVPTIRAVKGGMKSIVSSLQDNKCDAAVLRDHFYDKQLTDEQRASLAILHTSRQFPNQGISVSKTFTAEQITKIASLMQQDDAGLTPITNRFAKSSTHFIPSNDADYEGLNMLLEGVVWGW